MCMTSMGFALSSNSVLYFSTQRSYDQCYSVPPSGLTALPSHAFNLSLLIQHIHKSTSSNNPIAPPYHQPQHNDVRRAQQKAPFNPSPQQ